MVWESISEVCETVKRDLRMPKGLEILVHDTNGEVVHGRNKVRPRAVWRLVERAQHGKIRVADFCDRYAQCIGAQVAASVTLKMAGVPVDGRLAIGNFMPAQPEPAAAEDD